MRRSRSTTAEATTKAAPAAPASRKDCLTSAAPTARAPAANTRRVRRERCARTRHSTDSVDGTAASSSPGVQTAPIEIEPVSNAASRPAIQPARAPASARPIRLIVTTSTTAATAPSTRTPVSPPSTAILNNPTSSGGRSSQ